MTIVFILFFLFIVMSTYAILRQLAESEKKIANIIIQSFEDLEEELIKKQSNKMSRRVTYTSNSRDVYIFHTMINEKAINKAIKDINTKCKCYNIVTVYNPLLENDGIEVEVNNSMGMMKRVILLNTLNKYTHKDDILLLIDNPDNTVTEDYDACKVYSDITIEKNFYEFIQ